MKVNNRQVTMTGRFIKNDPLGIINCIKISILRILLYVGENN